MADVSYNIPDLRPGEVFRVEQTIKRSRFIATAAFADTEEKALAVLNAVRAANRTARHNVYAYELSSNKLKPNLKMPGTIAGLIVPEPPDLPIVSAQAMTASLTEPPDAPC